MLADDWDEWMRPLARFSLINCLRAICSTLDSEYMGLNSSWVLSSNSIWWSYGHCGGRVEALILLKTSLNSRYLAGTLDVISADSNVRLLLN